MFFLFTNMSFSDLPENLRELHLDQNQIQAIELADLSQYRELTRYEITVPQIFYYVGKAHHDSWLDLL